MAKTPAPTAALALLLWLTPANALEITQVEPAEAALGSLITITGMDFGTDKPPQVLLTRPGESKGLKLKVVSATDTSIVALVKKGLALTYDVTLQTKGKDRESATLPAALTLRAPALLSVDPLDPAAGDTVEILGHFFGLKKAKILITPAGETKGKKAKVLEWEPELPIGATQTAGAVGLVEAPTSRALIEIPKKLPGGPADLTLATKLGSLTQLDVFTLPDPPPRGGGGGSGGARCKGKNAFDADIGGPVNGEREFRANAVFWEQPFDGFQVLVQGCFAPVSDLCESVFTVNAFYNPAVPATLPCSSGSVFVFYGEGQGQAGRDYEADNFQGSCSVEIQVNGNKVEGRVIASLAPTRTPIGETPEQISVDACFKSNEKQEFMF